MNVFFAAALACIILWILLAFVFAIASGWAHLPLAVGATLIARGIVGRNRS